MKIPALRRYIIKVMGIYKDDYFRLFPHVPDQSQKTHFTVVAGPVSVQPRVAVLSIPFTSKAHTQGQRSGQVPQISKLKTRLNHVSPFCQAAPFLNSRTRYFQRRFSASEKLYLVLLWYMFDSVELQIMASPTYAARGKDSDQV